MQPGSLGCGDKTGFCEFPRALGGEGGSGNEATAGAAAAAAGSGQSPAGGGTDEGGRGSTQAGSTKGGRGSTEGGQVNAEGGNESSSASEARDSGGCGCSVPGRSTGWRAALALVALALVRRHRRYIAVRD